MERRLAAILAADVVGYSRLVREDEAGALAALKGHLDELIEPKIAERKGRIVKLMGDGLLAEFPSAVEAVQCAVEIQHWVGARTAEVAEERRVAYRIGINIGDIVVEGDDIYGDGVNVAARLEGLAEPGGICVARNVFSQVKDKLALTMEHLGEHEVKNIAEPIAIYRVVLDEQATALVTPVVPKPTKPASRRWVAAASAAAAIVLVAAAGGALWWQPWAPDVEPASIERMVFPLPDKPSIAVLPFANMSDDPSQEYFADGMTEDLITDLSKISGLFVISRSSTFTYKGRNVKVREVAEDLGVRYVLEGSVRRADGKVRINAQLVDATTGHHLWADRYDRGYTEIFVLQDEVIGRIVAALAVKLTDVEQEQVTRAPTENLEAYEHYIRAEQRRYSYDRFDLGVALGSYKEAMKLDPRFAQAFAGHALVLAEQLRLDETGLMPADLAREQSYESVTRALSLNPELSRAHSVLAVLQLVDEQHDEAVESARKAVLLDQNNAEGYANLALVLAYSGRPAEAWAAMQFALRLDPKPQAALHLISGEILFMDGQYNKAIKAFQNYRDTRSGCAECQLGASLQIAMTLAQLNRLDEANAEIKSVLDVSAWRNLGYTRLLYGYTKRKKDLDFRIDALRKAGLPEWPQGFSGSAGDRLKGPEIEALLFGKRWLGHSQIDLRAFAQKTDENSSVRYYLRGSTWDGTVSVEGDTICYRFSSVLLGRKACGHVYRNPDGNVEDTNEFVAVDAFDVHHFSPKE
jgi:TolB-like protein/class 3 adenylate cyclase/Flp pilus assembly protein TadD